MSFFKTRKDTSWLQSKYTSNFFIYQFIISFRLCNGGELFDKIAEEQYFSETDAAKIIK